MWAVVPVKTLAHAKQRLAAVLTPEERRGLMRAMLGDVLDAVMAARGLSGGLVVTRDVEAIALAEAAGARVLVEPDDRGQSAAVARAARALSRDGVRGIVTVPGDVPLLAPQDIERAMSGGPPAPSVVLVPSHDRRGSNCVVVRPPDALSFRFGPDSFARHLAAVRARGLAVDCPEIPGLALDIDEPADLSALTDRLPPGRTRDYLIASGISVRLGKPASFIEGATGRARA